MGTQTYNGGASGTWYVPAGVTSITVKCWGAGGNGHNVNDYTVMGGGGGGGGYCIKTATVTPGAGYTYLVAPNSAWNTSFVGTGFAMYANSGATATSCTGGANGTATGGDTNLSGYDQGFPYCTSDGYSIETGGHGGHSGDTTGGAGGAGAYTDWDQVDAFNAGQGITPGGGGGGGSYQNYLNELIGLAAIGGEGKIVITWTDPPTGPGTGMFLAI